MAKKMPATAENIAMPNPSKRSQRDSQMGPKSKKG
jgi:hypothetical protein